MDLEHEKMDYCSTEYQYGKLVFFFVHIFYARFHYRFKQNFGDIL